MCSIICVCVSEQAHDHECNYNTIEFRSGDAVFVWLSENVLLFAPWPCYGIQSAFIAILIFKWLRTSFLLKHFIIHSHIKIHSSDSISQFLPSDGTTMHC